jgi:hypothetical protein
MTARARATARGICFVAAGAVGSLAPASGCGRPRAGVAPGSNRTGRCSGWTARGNARRHSGSSFGCHAGGRRVGTDYRFACSIPSAGKAGQALRSGARRTARTRRRVFGWRTARCGRRSRGQCDCIRRCPQSQGVNPEMRRAAGRTRARQYVKPGATTGHRTAASDETRWGRRR